MLTCECILFSGPHRRAVAQLADRHTFTFFKAVEPIVYACVVQYVILRTMSYTLREYAYTHTLTWGQHM